MLNTQKRFGLKERMNRLSAPHLIVSARAGTGKTTTLVEGLKLIKHQEPGIEPSMQQEQIWDALVSGDAPQSIAMVAFNKSIATELQQKVPDGVNASTMHSMGMKAVMSRFGRVVVEQNRTDDLVVAAMNHAAQEAELKAATKEHREPIPVPEINIFWLRNNRPEFLPAAKRLVSLAKMTLSDPHRYEQLIDHYDIDCGDYAQDIMALVPDVLELAKDVERDKRIDFDDMVWLPVALGLPVRKYDLLLVDEAQDLNAVQQELAIKSGRRLVLVGDPYQAIYGFAGADCGSLDNMHRRLNKGDSRCEELLLTETRRCPQTVVKEASQIVKDFTAHDSNPQGAVTRMLDPSQLLELADGSMVLCRTTAPLVQLGFRMIACNRRVQIMGRDIGKGLLALIKKLKVSSCKELVAKIGMWLDSETEKEQKRDHPRDSKLLMLRDKHDCIVTLASRAMSLDGLKMTIDDLFSDQVSHRRVRLSTIHKSKGLEAPTVCLWEPGNSTVPHPMAKTSEQRRQEWNLRYVAITRAQKRLIYCSSEFED